MTDRLVALLCRSPDPEPERALAGQLAEGLGVAAREVGSPRVPAAAWEDELQSGRGCLLEAGGQVDDALVAGERPLLVAGDCCVCITTLPAVVRHHPEARVLWLDAHGDFNSPDTTSSDFLGGMCLAAACGVWDAGLSGDAPVLPPAHVVTYGVRDLDGGERVLMETNGVGRATRPSTLLDGLRGHKVFVHLDCDVLDPELMPAAYPAPGGMGDGDLKILLADVGRECDVVGVEVTALGAAHAAPMVTACVLALLED